MAGSTMANMVFNEHLQCFVPRSYERPARRPGSGALSDPPPAADAPADRVAVDPPSAVPPGQIGESPLWSVVVEVKITKPDGREQHYRQAALVQKAIADLQAAVRPDGVLPTGHFIGRNPDGVAVAVFTGDDPQPLADCFVAVDQPFNPAEDKVEARHRIHAAMPDPRLIRANWRLLGNPPI